MSYVVYEVNLEIQKEFAEKYMEWLKPHIIEMLNIDGFVSATINGFEHVGKDNNPNVVRKVITYKVESREKMQQYFDESARKMRGQATNKFSGKFKAWRRVIHPKIQFSKL